MKSNSAPFFAVNVERSRDHGQVNGAGFRRHGFEINIETDPFRDVLSNHTQHPGYAVSYIWAIHASTISSTFTWSSLSKSMY